MQVAFFCAVKSAKTNISLLKSHKLLISSAERPVVCIIISVGRFSFFILRVASCIPSIFPSSLAESRTSFCISMALTCSSYSRRSLGLML